MKEKIFHFYCRVLVTYAGQMLRLSERDTKKAEVPLKPLPSCITIGKITCRDVRLIQ